MSTTGTPYKQHIYPVVVYQDAIAAIEFLKIAFSFETLMAIQDENGVVNHAELRLGDDVIMIASTRESEGRISPKETGAFTQMIYVIVDEVDQHSKRARAAGARIVREPHDTDYGSREYGVKDLEGHDWSFGTYRPEI